eukprot:TRINITY_DN72703_c0_g1_i1.p1 TRINITY_DN72703_c0_g1~~TRINITY_DN72703_c0_g1_i1.p1  ORF type:complete len:208 (+),score=40.10 TRINITY_DN72703_c0_g1_i1:88-711(+)
MQRSVFLAAVLLAVPNSAANVKEFVPCKGQARFDIMMCSSHACSDCTLAWCGEFCQDVQKQFAGCRCRDWPEPRKSYSHYDMGSSGGSGMFMDTRDGSKCPMVEVAGPAADCCRSRSIYDDGRTKLRSKWPLVNVDTQNCMGGQKVTFQGWLNRVGTDGRYYICIDRKMYKPDCTEKLEAPAALGKYGDVGDYSKQATFELKPAPEE